MWQWSTTRGNKDWSIWPLLISSWSERYIYTLSTLYLMTLEYLSLSWRHHVRNRAFNNKHILSVYVWLTFKDTLLENILDISVDISFDYHCVLTVASLQCIYYTTYYTTVYTCYICTLICVQLVMQLCITATPLH